MLYSKVRSKINKRSTVEIFS